MEDKTAKMLETVRALLAKAESTEFEHEADAFRAKADELMTKYAIEQWQLDQAIANKSARVMPIKRDVDVSWYFAFDGQTSAVLWSIFNALAEHCRCKAVGVKMTSDLSSPIDYMGKRAYRRTVPVLGMPSDLDYMDLLFTHLLLQMVSKLSPEPKPGDDYITALVSMKEAGYGWQLIHSKLRKAGIMDDTPWTRNIGVRFTKHYSDFCKKTGRPQIGKGRTQSNPEVYRRSFVEGYSYEIRHRLREMRETQGQDVQGSGMELALRDIRLQVQDFMKELYPELFKPIEPIKVDPNAKKPSTRTIKLKEYAYNYDAMSRGQKAGREAQILIKDGLKRRGELEG